MWRQAARNSLPLIWRRMQSFETFRPLKASQPLVEWQRIGAFRNLLVHNYLGIDLDIVWGIVERDVPRLKIAAQAMRELLTQRPATEPEH